MKKAVHIFAVLFILSMLSACEKKENPVVKKIEIDDKDLSVCPPNANCEFLYIENADANRNTGEFKPGSNRLFFATINLPGINQKVYIRTPMDVNEFELTKNDIIDGKVNFVSICPACYMTPQQAIGGYVRGVNLTPENRSDQSKWILDIQLIVGDLNDASSYRDTIRVKQYFYPNFVMN